MRLIDADALMKEVCEIKCGCEPNECEDEYGFEKYCAIAQHIEHAPTVDVVPKPFIVSCLNCIYLDHDSGLTARKCKKHNIITKQSDFCSYGKEHNEKSSNSEKWIKFKNHVFVSRA